MTLRRDQNQDVRGRLDAWTQPVVGTPELSSPFGPGPAATTAAERSLSKLDWWPRLVEQLELAEVTTTAFRWLLQVAISTIVIAWMVSELISPIVGVLALVLVPLIARFVIRRRVKRLRRLFGEQLADALQATASAMRVGTSFSGALAVLVEDAAEPARSEFARVVSDEQLGVNIEEALSSVTRRMDSRDMEQVTMVAALQRETGGGGAEALEQVAHNVRGRQELRRLIQGLTAQGRMSQYVMTCLPVALFGILLLINGEYMKPMFSSAIGHVALGMAITLTAIGWQWINKLVEIEV